MRVQLPTGVILEGSEDIVGTYIKTMGAKDVTAPVTSESSTSKYRTKKIKQADPVEGED